MNLSKNHNKNREYPTKREIARGAMVSEIGEFEEKKLKLQHEINNLTYKISRLEEAIDVVDDISNVE